VVVTPATGTSTTVPIAFGVEFSGPVQGFDAADVVLGGTAGASGVTVTGSGASYVATVADAQRAGTVTAQVVALAATRYGLANGASNVASTTFAPPRPSATVEQSAAQSDPTPDPVATFDVTFSEPVTGLDAADLVVGGTAGATQVSLSGSGAAYVATVTGAVRPGTITLALGEAAATSRFGEASLAATSTDAEVSFDPGTPALAIERASGQDAITTSDEVAFAATFSQPVTGFDVDDVVLGGTTGGTVTVTGSGADYAIVVSGLERAGEVSVSVPAEAATS
ncbi:hypothetical protein, partial [Burkholderia cenocepacia]|uniref:hypothetical protein n=1 Tax=Burkholderia cenocepacia TaxID=95486 RepID=UPI0038CC0EDB